MTDSHSTTAREIPATSSLRFSRLDLALLAGVLVFYAATRLIGIADFPIYFFCDEATQANLAAELVDNGLRDRDGNLFPPYFLNVKVYNLGLSVWLHAPTVAAFGKSITVVRATSVAVGLLGAAALMVSLKVGFGTPLWWLGGLVFAALPSWFLHSRTAFETAMMVGFYACFVCAYVLYRKISPWWLPVAVVCGAATFYSYSNGQGVMFVTCSLLLVADWRYHWRVVRTRPWAVAAAAATAAAVAAPYLRFRFVLHPEMMADHFYDLNSYWVQELPLQEKLAIFVRTYLHGLSPAYWFFDDVEELVRHRMLGYGQLPLWLAPAIAIGLAHSLWRSWRSSLDRLLLIAVLAAPFSAAIVDIRITRVLAMMVPATALAVLGLERLRRWLKPWVPTAVFAVAVAAVLVGATAAMTADALKQGKTWFDDYGMGGLQWGAEQVFGVLRSMLEQDRDIRFIISHSWANWPDAFPRFFLDEELLQRVRMGVIEEYLVNFRPREIAPTQPFVMTPGEYELARSHPMLEVDEPLEVILYPDGRPGFYIVPVEYSDDARAIFEAEQAERRRPVQTETELDGVRLRVVHPKFDVGTVDNLFDRREDTIARTLDADPCALIFSLATPRPVSGARVQVWSPRYRLRLRVTDANGAVYEADAAVNLVEGFGIYELRLPEPVAEAREVVVVIDKSGDNKVHIQEIEFVD